jgi:hypothetical protein
MPKHVGKNVTINIKGRNVLRNLDKTYAPSYRASLPRRLTLNSTEVNNIGQKALRKCVYVNCVKILYFSSPFINNNSYLKTNQLHKSLCIWLVFNYKLRVKIVFKFGYGSSCAFSTFWKLKRPFHSIASQRLKLKSYLRLNFLTKLCHSRQNRV